MKKSILNNALLMFCTFLFLSTTACGFHYNVKGQVVDAITGKPIEGASIAVHWLGQKIGPVPLASGAYTIEKAKDISDKDGFFKVPRYFFKSLYMAIYKKGYVCWDNRHIFLQGAGIEVKDQFGIKTHHGKPRIGFKVRDGMVIKLEPFTATDRYIRVRHASFVLTSSRVSGGLTGIGDERKIELDEIRKQKEERLKKKINKKNN